MTNTIVCDFVVAAGDLRPPCGETEIARSWYGSFALLAGRNGTGAIHVSGDGTRISLSSSFGGYGGRFADSAGVLNVALGPSGSGSVIVENGGEIRISNEAGRSVQSFASFGRDDGSYGYLKVSGAGSTLALIDSGTPLNSPALSDGSSNGNGPALKIGRSGEGVAVVENGGEINLVGGSALLAVSDKNNDSSNTVANDSELIVRSGGKVSINSLGYNYGGMVIGRDEGDDGYVRVDGINSGITITSNAGAEANNGAFLQVGRLGAGELQITNGASVVVDGNGDLVPLVQVGAGIESGAVSAYGLVVVDGTGSTLALRGDNLSHASSGGLLTIGEQEGSIGQIVVRNGANLSVDGQNSVTAIAPSAGAAGRITVTGEASSFDAGAFLSVGAVFSSGFEQALVDYSIGGSAELIVSNGGAFMADQTVTGTNSLIDLEGVIDTDLEVHGRFEVASGAAGSLTINGNLTLGEGSRTTFNISDFGNDIGDRIDVNGDFSFDIINPTFAANIDSESVRHGVE